MRSTDWCSLALAFGVSLLIAPPAAAQTADSADVAVLLTKLETALQTGNADDFLELLVDDPETRDQAVGFLDENTLLGATRVVVHEADRRTLPDVPGGLRLMLELLTERGDQGRIATWRLDLQRESASNGRWTIVDQERLTFIEGLYRLSLDDTMQYRVRSLTMTAEDLTVTLPEGTAFAIRTEQGTTGLVLLGRGTMQFAPTPEAEQTQIQILSGSHVLDAQFNSAYIRLNPSNYSDVLTGVLTEQPISRRDLQRAQAIFVRNAPQSFTLDLGPLSRDRWWIVPNLGDFLADFETRRYDTLTYLRTKRSSEDIKLFDRGSGRMISTYASRERVAERGRFYSENDGLDYDVLHHDIDVTFAPEREWIQGNARMRVRALNNMTSMTIRLAEELVVQSITSEPFGPLQALRVPGQNGILLNFPTTVAENFEFELQVSYSGPLAPEVASDQSRRIRAAPFLDSPSVESLFRAQQPRQNFLYSNRSYWYPQSQVTDYATANLRVVVPPDYACVSSGELQAGSPILLPEGEPGAPPGSSRYVFATTQPVRYLATVIGEFASGPSTALLLEDILAAHRPSDIDRQPAGDQYDNIELSVESNIRNMGDHLARLKRAEDAIEFYAGLIGDVPYGTLTLALMESDRPGGHSPAYFSMLNQPIQSSIVVWNRDPVYFHNVPEFFLAHEIAHQWWGQAIGWNNYHEQWLSEGFAQYFAALYAERVRGTEAFDKIIRQMSGWAIEHSDQGPIYLGYRLGHIESDEEVFRSILYNKSAVVIHMLRRLIGDDAFFRGLREFYAEWRFKKAGSEDLRRAFESTSGRSLERFFEGWIYGAGIPELTFSYRIDDGRASGDEQSGSVGVLRFEQRGPIFDVPVTVRLKYASGETEDVIVKVSDTMTELRVPLHGTLRTAEANADFAALARIDER